MRVIRVLSHLAGSISAALVLGAGPASSAIGSPLEAPVPACEVFAHPGTFDGKTVEIRGVYVQYTEGAFLKGYPKCNTLQPALASVHGTRDAILSWRKGGGYKGAWMLCDMTGEFEINRVGGYEFHIKSLVVLRRVEPYAGADAGNHKPLTE